MASGHSSDGESIAANPKYNQQTLELERQALKLFIDLMDQPAVQRQSALAITATSSPQLAARVGELLATDAKTGGGLADTELPALPVLQEPPEHLGPYRLLRRLGVGGMGQVFLAERVDGEFDRQVAIKLVGLAALTDKGLVRFDAERRILAGLQHQQIVSVLDSGTQRGVPYLVMEYIQGEPFAYSPQLSQQVQLRRFVKVCTAVAHAHGRLVLHRDIKPSNVLIDTTGEPKLLDFGVAKLLDDVSSGGSSLTGTGQMLLTTTHAAPECLRGEPATVQSDIYSLGVMLYEILVGALPFAEPNQSAVQALKLVEAGGLVRPATLAPDLFRILQVAMHVDADRRYTTVAALKSDIEEFLANRPIAARRDDAWYVFRKFARRHWVGLSAAVLVAGILLGSLVVVTNALEEAQLQRDQAETEGKNAAAAMAFMSMVLQSANPASLKPISTLNEALVEAERHLEKDDTVLSDTGKVMVYLNLATISSGRGLPDKAIEYQRAAHKLLDGISQSFNLGAQWGALAQGYNELNRPDLALPAAQRALELAEQLPTQDAVSRRRLVSVVAGAQLSSGMTNESIALLEQELKREGVDQDTHRVDFAALYHLLSLGYAALKNVDLYVANNEQALTLMEQAGALDSADGMRVQTVRVQALEELGKTKEADQLYQKLLSQQQELLGTTHDRVVEMVANRGALLRDRGELAQAIEHMSLLEDHVRHQMPSSNGLVSYFMSKLGYARCTSGLEIQQGKRDLEYALQTSDVSRGAQSWWRADIIGAIGYCEMLLGEFDSAEANIRESHQLFEAAWGPEHSATKSKLRWLDELTAKRQQTLDAAN